MWTLDTFLQSELTADPGSASAHSHGRIIFPVLDGMLGKDGGLIRCRVILGTSPENGQMSSSGSAEIEEVLLGSRPEVGEEQEQG